MLRKDIEQDNYFHSVVLEDYRYKGDQLYKTVKADLKKHSKAYKSVMDALDSRATIIHISQDAGQLDFLLALDRPDRKLYTYIEDQHLQAIVKNSYIASTHYKIHVGDSLEETLKNDANTIILNSKSINENQIKSIADTANIFILLKENKLQYTDLIISLGFGVAFEDKTLIILKK